jgi:hypothetical protein
MHIAVCRSDRGGGRKAGTEERAEAGLAPPEIRLDTLMEHGLRLTNNARAANE